MKPTERSSILGLLSIFVPILLIASTLATWITGAVFWGGVEAQVLRGDFAPTLVGGRIIEMGAGRDLYSLSEQRSVQLRLYPETAQTNHVELLPYLHTPVEAVLSAALLYAGANEVLIYALWQLACIMALLISLFLLQRVLPIPKSNVPVVVLTLVSSAPVLLGFSVGQASPFILLGISAAYAALRSGKEFSAGAALLLLTIKPQTLPLLLLVLAIAGRWRGICAFLALAATGIVVLMPLLGNGWLLGYLRFLDLVSEKGTAFGIHTEKMPNVHGFVTNVISSITPNAVTPALLVLDGVIVVLLVNACWRQRRAPHDRIEQMPKRACHCHAFVIDDRLWSLCILASALVALHQHIYDHVMLLFPAWVLCARHASYSPLETASVCTGGYPRSLRAGLYIGTSSGLLPKRWTMLGWTAYISYLIPVSSVAAVISSMVIGTAYFLLWREMVCDRFPTKHMQVDLS